MTLHYIANPFGNIEKIPESLPDPPFLKVTGRREKPKIREAHLEVARAGALRLDEKMPGWAPNIDKRRLHMQNADECILGQLYPGGYSVGCFWLDVAFCPLTLCKFGFHLGLNYCEEDNQAFRDAEMSLRQAWIHEIESRLAKAA